MPMPYKRLLLLDFTYRRCPRAKVAAYDAAKLISGIIARVTASSISTFTPHLLLQYTSMKHFGEII